ncbi:hypothetical protein V501_00841 [Pseudogymnoascus sp. VKM F-4519 (FW-2642)]|nr:hypothetical protein V501_00841 [Pseudogymnoascus sp. VKM F-4519 (FW-2642)]
MAKSEPPSPPAMAELLSPDAAATEPPTTPDTLGVPEINIQAATPPMTCAETFTHWGRLAAGQLLLKPHPVYDPKVRKGLRRSPSSLTLSELAGVDGRPEVSDSNDDIIISITPPQQQKPTPQNSPAPREKANLPGPSEVPDPSEDSEIVQSLEGLSSLGNLSKTFSLSFTNLFSAAKDADKPGLLSRKMGPRPQTATTELEVPAPTFDPAQKPRKLAKANSMGINRDPSPSPHSMPPPPTPPFAASSQSRFLSSRDSSPGSRPQTRDGSPMQYPPLFDTGHRVPSASSMSTMAPPSYMSDSEGSDRSKLRSRLTFMPRSRDSSRPTSSAGSAPWVLGGPNKVDYNLAPLLSGERVTELWDDTADVNVYLFPTGNKPSFKIPSRVIETSAMLMNIAFSQSPTSPISIASPVSFNMPTSPTIVNPEPTILEDAVMNAPDEAMKRLDFNFDLPHRRPSADLSAYLSADGFAQGDLMAKPNQTPREGHLYFPITRLTIPQNLQDAGSDTDRLLAARNLIAFLLHKPLIASMRFPTEISVFLGIASHLADVDFLDESSGDFGRVITTAFSFYNDIYNLQDVRGSFQKMLQGVIMGEAMRHAQLYREGFIHCVGAYGCKGIREHKLFAMVSDATKSKIEREALDLEHRQKSIKTRLQDFDFPHIFNGTAASKVTAESKTVRFTAWRSHFVAFRSFVLSYYKDLHGSWPPKSGKRSGFQISGLNRLALKILYDDLAALYDILVDREALTTRTLDVEDVKGEDDMTQGQLELLALRKIMSEHDRSSIPVTPPIPFDLPKLPTPTTLDAGHPKRSAKAQVTAETRRLRPFEKLLVLAKAHNVSVGLQTPFLRKYAEFEDEQASGSSIRDLRDQRFGYWIFLYAVLQCLPPLVMDAPGIRYTGGVEYFLCKPPLGHLPWQDGRTMRDYPFDAAENTAEAIYTRSHCWMAGADWLPPLQARAALEGGPVLANSPYLAPVDVSTRDGSGSPVSPAGSPATFEFPAPPLRPSRLSSATPPPDLLRHDSMATVVRRPPSRQQPGREEWQPAEFFGDAGAPPGVGLGAELLSVSRPTSRHMSSRPVSRATSAFGGAGSVSGVSSAGVAPGNGPSTFDDILGGMKEEEARGREKEREEKKKAKKGRISLWGN